MRKILAGIGAVILGAIAVVLVLAAMKPDTFTVRRSAAIKAPAEKIYPHIADLRAFAAWSPYEKKDPAMKRTYSGAAIGKGSVYEWDGDKNVGAGRLIIAELSSPSKVTMQLEMLRPIEAHNMVDFTLAPAGDSTNVTWSMRGEVPFFAKIIHVFLDMDRMVGGDFEVGLASLKAVAEK